MGWVVGVNGADWADLGVILVVLAGRWEDLREGWFDPPEADLQQLPPKADGTHHERAGDNGGQSHHELELGGRIVKWYGWVAGGARVKCHWQWERGEDFPEN